MLLLARKVNESIVIDGRIIVKIVRLEGETVKVGIEAPADVPIHRQEVYDEIQKNNQQALTGASLAVPKLLKTSQTPETDALIASVCSNKPSAPKPVTPVQPQEKSKGR